MRGVTGLQFILFLGVFYGFFLLILGLGGVNYVASSFECQGNITTNCLNVTSIQEGVDEPPTGFLGTLDYVVSNIGLVFTLMFVNPFHPSAILLWFIIGLPTILGIVYIVLVLIRGGGA